MDAVWFYCFKRNKCILIQLQIFFGGLSRLIYEDGYTSKNFLKQKQQWFLSYQQNIYHFPTFLGTTIEIGSHSPLAFNLYRRNIYMFKYVDIFLTFLGTTIDIGSHSPLAFNLYSRNISHLFTSTALLGSTPNPLCGVVLEYWLK